MRRLLTEHPSKIQDIPISQRMRKDVKRNTRRSPAMNASAMNKSATKASERPHEAITLGLVRAVKGMRGAAMPEERREVARHCLLDCLGTAIAGSREPLTEILVREIAAGEGSSQAGLIGRRERCSRMSAALVNGAAAHALDFDDTHMAMNGHPS